LPYLFIFITSFLTPDKVALVQFKFTFANYIKAFNPIYLRIFLRSFYLAAISTFLCLILAYPFAFILAKNQSRYKQWLLLLVIIPLWKSSLTRTYAIMDLLKAKSIFNTFLLLLGVIHTPLNILYSNTAVVIGLVYNLLPFMILPLYANIERLDDQL